VWKELPPIQEQSFWENKEGFLVRRQTLLEPSLDDKVVQKTEENTHLLLPERNMPTVSTADLISNCRLYYSHIKDVKEVHAIIHVYN
jgi:hypothetical protein